MQSTRLAVTGGIVQRSTRPVELLGRADRAPLQLIAVAAST